MGNQGSMLGDEPTMAQQADRNLAHFEHHFKGDIHTVGGSVFVQAFGEASFAKRPMNLECKGQDMVVVEEVGLSSDRRQLSIPYNRITAVGWDHGSSEVKLTVDFRTAPDDDNFIIMSMPDTVAFEGEMKLRFSGIATSDGEFKWPNTVYVGMFAGATKPRPFQRKRPNLSRLPQGKLPTLNEMRDLAVQLYRGSYSPCAPGESRRMDLAIQHIFEGHNYFDLINVRGTSLSNQWRQESTLVMNDDALVFRPFGTPSNAVDIPYEEIQEWNSIDNDHLRRGESGIEVIKRNGESIIFGVRFIRDAKHTLEYYWNRFQVRNGGSVKLGSTHGRPIATFSTLSGELPLSEVPVPKGSYEVVDQDGMLVRPGGKLIRRGSVMDSILTDTSKPQVVPHENRDVKKHWHRLVVHQGWLQKKGGVGIGDVKSWIKRYFVLYGTSQGHFLIYYSDFTECPLYSTERAQRNIVDLSKCTFIRPGSNKAEFADTPPHSFDIVTTEREWTLCAESQENVNRWLKLLNRCVDEDVAILPDESLVFNVKPKSDPLGVLPASDYTTALKVSSQGISVCTPDPINSNAEREHFFWVYTDFFKWSLLSQNGKIALLLNVFADSSFSRRHEFVFRTKEAVKLASAIEYFIEKFMSVMHIRLEIMDSESNRAEDNQKGVGMHEQTAEDYQQDIVREVDLLSIDDTPPPSRPAPSIPTQSQSSAFGADPFGSDPFGSPAPAAKTTTNTSSSASSDPFGGSDPFGSDPFGSPAPAAPAAPSIKTAPPLNPMQISQHQQWFIGALLAGVGPFYDDGCLKMMIKCEVRGSQGRYQFQLINSGNTTINDLKIDLVDSSNFLRFEAAPFSSTLAAQANVVASFMVECMKPAFPGPQLKVTYTESNLGVRNNQVPVPILSSSFNEPLAFPANDFMQKWNQLSQPAMQVQEVIKCPRGVVPANVTRAFIQGMKFGSITGIPDESETVVYGASTLRTGSVGPNNEKMSIGCLVKIEMNVQASAIRVTVRATHPAAASALVETAKSLMV